MHSAPRGSLDNLPLRCLWHHVAFSPHVTPPKLKCCWSLSSAKSPLSHLYQQPCSLVRAASPVSFSWAQGSHSPGVPNHGKASTRATWEGFSQPGSWGTVPGLTTALGNPHRLPRAVGQHTEKTAEPEQPVKQCKKTQESPRPEPWPCQDSPAFHPLFFSEKKSSSQKNSFPGGFSNVHQKVTHKDINAKWLTVTCKNSNCGGAFGLPWDS